MSEVTQRMPRKTQPPKESPAPVRKLGATLTRSLAKGTVLAAGLAATHFAIPEMDPRFHVFTPGLLDRLNAPITRYHE
jgi:hypothetical protein